MITILQKYYRFKRNIAYVVRRGGFIVFI